MKKIKQRIALINMILTGFLITGTPALVRSSFCNSEMLPFNSIRKEVIFSNFILNQREK